MSLSRRTSIAAAAALGAITLCAYGLEITRHTTEGGGGTRDASANFRISGTIGQSAVGPVGETTSYRLLSGFWGAVHPLAFEPLHADFNLDARVDAYDLLILIRAIRNNATYPDLDWSGKADPGDLVPFSTYWGLTR